jgi:hypothetical protein
VGIDESLPSVEVVPRIMAAILADVDAAIAAEVMHPVQNKKFRPRQIFTVTFFEPLSN